MFLEEFLIKIGVDASQAGEISRVVNSLQNGANQLSNAANNIQTDTNKAIQDVTKSTSEAGKATEKAKSKLLSLKLILVALAGAAVLYAKKLVGAFNDAIDKTHELAFKKDTLFKISQKEINQAMLYKREIDKTGLALDSIKTKIALDLAPAITNLIGGFRNWLTINKELIANGITKIIKGVGMVIQVFMNYYKFLDMIITNTIGWKNALIVLGAAWAVFNRAFLASPIGIVIGLLTVLMLLVDDLMVYMNGGKTLFGESWQPFIDGAKAAWEFLLTYWEFLKAFWSGNTDKAKSSLNKLFKSIINGVKSLVKSVKALLSNLLKNILMFLGMPEKDAKKTVDRVGKIFSTIFDVITFPYRTAYKAVCAIMDWLGISAGDVVNSIGEVFKAIWTFITNPFKSAWKSVNDLFDIWEDDTTTTTEKIKKTFKVIAEHITSPFKTAWTVVKKLFKLWIGDSDDTINSFDKNFSKIHNVITAPFKKAIDWIKDKFFGFIDTVKNKTKSALSWTGLFDDDKDTEMVIRRNVQAKFNTDLTAVGGVLASKNINNNKAVTINNTMNVTTPQEGFDNLNNISNNAIRNLADNTATAMGYN